MTVATPQAETRPPNELAGPLTGARAVARVIAEMDTPIVFGMPGGYTMHIYDALFDYRDVVETHLVRQESVGTVMAEAQGRLTNRPAVVMGQGAWILGNAGIGIMEAHLGSSPMVILMDATDGGSFAHLGPYQAGLGGYGAVDLPAAMRAITKHTFVAHDATQAFQMTQLAIKHSTAGEPGPVAVVFTGRSLFDVVDPASQPPTLFGRSRVISSNATINVQEVAAAADAVRNSRSPVIIAGNGIRLSGAEGELLAFASEHGIPVATTPAGKGTFPENHPLALGVIGAFGHDSANRGVGEADLIIAVGTKLGATDTANANRKLIDPERQTLIQIDIEPLNLGWTFPVDQRLQGDAAEALQHLRLSLQQWQSDGVTRVNALRGELEYFDRPFSSTDGEFSARDAARILSEELPEDAVVTCDAGENRLYVLRDFQSKSGGTVLQPNGGGGMGYAIPAALAAALQPDARLAVATCGDGGLAMSLHGVLSAVELGVKMLVVVFDNQILGWVNHGQRERPIASEFSAFDFPAITRAMGCDSYDAVDGASFRQALVDAQKSEGVSVIVAKTSRTDRYQDVMSGLHTADTYAVPAHNEY